MTEPALVKLEFTPEGFIYVNLNAVAEVQFRQEIDGLVAQVQYVGGTREQGGPTAAFHGQAAEQLRTALAHRVSRDETPA